jgi:peptidoglycan/xylan/chitin deacetylase (PgdA/CDA1 family)
MRPSGRRCLALSLAHPLALGLGLLVAAGLAPTARAERVALTFDDVPQIALTDSAGYARITTDRLLAGLRRRRLPAIGFVVGDKLEGPDHDSRTPLLEDWLGAGETLGNHTYDHDSLNKTPLPDYLASVAQNDALLRPLLAAHGQAPVWFRHPYLETGKTAEVRDGLEGWLKAHGYKVAPVTMENSDWMFALPYDEAVLKGDRIEARRIRREYLHYTARVVPWYRKAALHLLGRRPSQVFLLHASRLNADSIDQIAVILGRNHLKAVSLDQAMRDPVYALSEGEPEEAGDEWLSRWSVVLHKSLPWKTFPEPPADIAAAEDRLDKDP